MKKKTSVDIILPNYNSSQFIAKTIKSVQNQSFKNWKLIIVDDCSDTKTKKILKRYSKNKKIKIYWMKKNRGAAYCRNLGLKKSNSNFIAFIDSDDLWKKNKLDLQINYMNKNNYFFTYTAYKTFGLQKKNINPPERLSYSEFIKNTSIATSTMIVNSKIIKGVKFTNTKICEDYFFKCQILKKISKANCLNKYLTYYRVRQGSLQSNKLRNLFWIWKINYRYNKLSFFENLNFLFLISFNSIKKYGLK